MSCRHIRTCVVFLTSCLWLGLPRGECEILDPTAFASSGAMTIPSGTWMVDTSAIPVIRDQGGIVKYTGTVVSQGVPNGVPYHGYNSEIAVFAFDNITISVDAVLQATGSRPLALLSQGTIVVAGSINASGQDGHNGSGNLGCDSDGKGGAGGPGGGRGGNGSGESGIGPGRGDGGTNGLSSRADGGGFGSAGGNGTGGPGGGIAYGNLRHALQAGSGGGASGSDLFCRVGAGGGGGGGALELGASTEIFINKGQVLANGGKWGAGGTILAGGGSGGGIILHAPIVRGDSGLVQAAGAGPPGNAGAGGGGRILVLSDVAASPLGITFSVAGGGVNTSPGVLEFAKLGGNPADLNGDGMIDAADAQIMFADWGASGASDINGDGVVDAADAGELFADWTGDSPPIPLPEPASFAVPALALFVASLRSRI